MYKNAMKCNKTLSKWCKNKHEASKIIDTFETYQCTTPLVSWRGPDGNRATTLLLGGDGAMARVFAGSALQA
jgi:hypothetical protein